MEEEIEALLSLYDTLSIVSGDIVTELTMLCRPRHSTSFVSALIHIVLPPDYPNVSIRSFNIVKSCGLIDEGATIVSKVNEYIKDTYIPGEPILFQLFDLVFDCLDASNQGECLICAEELLTSQEGRESQGLLTKCQHSFHVRCLSRWAAISMCQSQLRAQGSTAQSRDDSELRHLQGTMRSVEKDIEGLQTTIAKWQEEMAQLSTILLSSTPTPTTSTTTNITAGTTGTGLTTASTTPFSSITALKLAIKERRGKLSDTVGAIQKNSNKGEKARLTHEATGLRQEIAQNEAKLSELEGLIKHAGKADKDKDGVVLDGTGLDKCLTKCMSKEKDTATQRLTHLQTCVVEAESKRTRCEKKLVEHREALSVASERLRDKGLTSASLQTFPCPVCREALLAAGGEDVGLTAKTDLQGFQSMISTHTETERQGLAHRQKEGLLEGQIEGPRQGHDLGHNQLSHPISCSPPCNEISTSVFSLPPDLHEYVRRIQREQQALRSSRTKDNT